RVVREHPRLIRRPDTDVQARLREVDTEVASHRNHIRSRAGLAIIRGIRPAIDGRHHFRRRSASRRSLLQGPWAGCGLKVPTFARDPRNERAARPGLSEYRPLAAKQPRGLRQAAFVFYHRTWPDREPSIMLDRHAVEGAQVRQEPVHVTATHIRRG